MPLANLKSCTYIMQNGQQLINSLMSYKRQEDFEESQPFFAASSNNSRDNAPIEMHSMGAQQQPTFVQIPHGYYLPPASDNAQQHQQATMLPPSYYGYGHLQNQHMQTPHSEIPAYHHHLPPPVHNVPPEFRIEEPFIPVDPNQRNEFYIAAAGLIAGFFIPVAWCSGWFFFRSPQRGTRLLARTSLAFICIGVVLLALFVLLAVFAIANMPLIPMCDQLTANARIEGCSACFAQTGCGWCPATSQCVPMFKADDRRGDRKGHPDRHPNSKFHTMQTMCDPSKIVITPEQCPHPSPSSVVPVLDASQETRKQS